MSGASFTTRPLVVLMTWCWLPTHAFNAPFSPPTNTQVERGRSYGVETPGTIMQQAVARMFDFEHARAANYERFGKHEYWCDPRIHNFGNTGWRGLLHALVVPMATHAIDRFAYDGVDARKAIHESEFPEDAEVVDLCSGVGFSSARKGRVTAVDTSSEMLAIARLRRPDVHVFEVGNAETWGEVR